MCWTLPDRAPSLAESVDFRSSLCAGIRHSLGVVASKGQEKGQRPEGVLYTDRGRSILGDGDLPSSVDPVMGHRGEANSLDVLEGTDRLSIRIAPDHLVFLSSASFGNRAA